jgi:hypothetical protein
LLEPIPQGRQTAGDCGLLLSRLARASGGGEECLVRRLHDGLEHVSRTGSAATLDEHLKHLADVDAERAHAGYGLMRLIVWAIPILGFLGTVIGITMAIASLKPNALEESMVEVTAGLGVAFDTTALALALSIILMFVQFYVDRAESGLLAAVDERVQAELLGRFADAGAAPDGQLVLLRRMGQTMIESMDGLVRRQAELWRSTIDAAQKRWTELADAAGRHLHAALSAALTDSLRAHAQELVAAERAAAEKSQRSWSEAQRALVQSSETLVAVQGALADKAEVLARAVEATLCVAKLEETLNHNLAALAGAKNFEETVMSLAAAIHLLNARLGDLPGKSPVLHLDPVRRKGQAA